MSLEKLKLSKPLTTAMTDAGYLTAKEIQVKTVSRIIGGQDVMAVAPDGAGKTTAYILGLLMKLKYTTDEAPRALILVADKERGEAVIETFKQLAGNRNLRITGAFGVGGMEGEINELVDGTDVVVALPTRARAIYLKLGLNLNKLQVLIVDDAELIVKQGMQLPVCELARSAGKCQHLIFTTVVHSKLLHMTDQFMEDHVTVEVEEVGERAQTHELLLYHTTNFKTKLNLLDHLLRDEEVFDKVVVFVNTRLNADKLQKSLRSNREEEVLVLNPLFFDDAGFDTIEDFKSTPGARILIVANETHPSVDLTDIPVIFHFEIPEKIEILLNRIVKRDESTLLAFTFATDLELSEVKKIEQSIGFKIPQLELPADLVVDREVKKVKTTRKKMDDDQNLPQGNGAFHAKKESNVKNHNFGMGQKAVMNKKKKHG